MAVGPITTGTRSLIITGSNPAASPAIPAGAGAGDRLVVIDMIRATNNTVPNTPGTPSGWTSKNTFGFAGVSRAVRMTWFYRTWASGMATPSITLTGASGTFHYAIMYRIPGALLSADPTAYLGADGNPANSSSLLGPFAGGSTSADGSAVLVAAVRENDVTDGSSVTAPTHAGLSFTLHDSYGTGAGEDAVFAVASALAPVPLTVGNLSFGISHDTAQKAIGQQWGIAPEPEAAVARGRHFLTLAS